MSATSLTAAPGGGATGSPASSNDGVVSRPAVTVLPVAAAALTVSGSTTAQAQSQPGFQIEVLFPDNSLSATQRAAFTTAAARWQQVITGDVPDVNLGFGNFIDDVQITATGQSIDGAGGILGQAGPTQERGGTFLPATGIMSFDTADLASMEGNGTLVNVITHEMAHVLGYGTIWTNKNLVTGAGGADPRYTGAAAVAEYRSLFGAADETSIPLENAATAGAGTRDVHWRETTFGTELLTGFIGTGSSPQSRVSAAQFIDLGYPGVNLNAADSFTPPLSLSAVTPSAGVVAPGMSVALTATVINTAGQINSVSFYRESNGVAGLQTAGATPDALVGTDGLSVGGYSVDATTAGLAAGNYRFYARATDVDGESSAAGTSAAFGQVAVAITGDINLNGTVGPEDFNLLATNFGQSGKTWTSGDLSGNGLVGPEDFNLLATNFGQSLPALLTASVLSSPSTASLASSTSAPATTTKGVTAAVPATSVLKAMAPAGSTVARYHKHR